MRDDVIVYGTKLAVQVVWSPMKIKSENDKPLDFIYLLRRVLSCQEMLTLKWVKTLYLTSFRFSLVNTNTRLSTHQNGFTATNTSIKSRQISCGTCLVKRGRISSFKIQNKFSSFFVFFLSRGLVGTLWASPLFVHIYSRNLY